MPKVRDTNIEARFGVRRRGGPPRYYADFRDYKDVGGKVEKLCPSGEHYATTSEAEAKALADARLQQLKARRAMRPTGPATSRTRGRFAAHHLMQKAMSEEADTQWLAAAERHLAEAQAYFGDRRDVGDIQVSDVSAYVMHLRALSNGRGGTLSSGTASRSIAPGAVIEIEPEMRQRFNDASVRRRDVASAFKRSHIISQRRKTDGSARE